MKKIVLFEPSISSLNLGDYIIVDSVKRELSSILNDSYVIEQPTQTPVMHFYQKKDPRLKLSRDSDYKFVCGSNLIWQNMFSLNPQWNINIFNCTNIIGSILVGVGSGTTRKKMNLYTKHLYQKVLSKKYIHSVRDEATCNRLKSIGINAINTGCVTTWCLTKEHCKKIPVSKSNNVVFTLTDYQKDEKSDKQLIEILINNYKDVYYWPQGVGDYEYINHLGYSSKIKIISPSLEAMRKLLLSGDIDYVGTRLHGGIFAMQNYVRSIIIIVDNRAREMKERYNLPTIERNNIDDLTKMISSSWKTNININEEAISKWKGQF